MLENFLREYNINRILLSITGLWPYQNKVVRSLLWTFCFLLEISYYPFEILLFHDHSDDAQLIFEGGYQTLILTNFVIRHLNDVLHSDKMRCLYEAIDEHWNIFTDDIEIRILKEYSCLSQKIVIYYSMLFFSSLVVIIILPLTPIFLDILMPLNESRPRFFAMEVEFRVNKDEYFLPIFCYTNLVIVVGVFIALGFDSMHITCTAHACSLFAAISKQIENVLLKVDDNNNIEKSEHVNKKLELLNEEITYRKYIKCLKKHQLAIEFVEILNSSYQECALAILIVLLGILSLVGIRIIYVLHELGTLIKFVFIFITTLCVLLVPCYSGQRIMDESQNIFYRAYATEWYKFSHRLKSLLLITLYRSNKPCGLKAGNMIPLSIATYATVVRMSMSYYTALLSMQD
ncbi:odorant receptor 63a [Solenopsis invicta]|uniref:odorant receptor 63a n=1 Tax=Solenopsis invicta TaxID=13686 RepID=UPI00193E9404|nr:odorant receptor 63a [Solenopsis invicta]